jgi:hypothetical protein
MTWTSFFFCNFQALQRRDQEQPPLDLGIGWDPIDGENRWPAGPRQSHVCWSLWLSKAHVLSSNSRRVACCCPRLKTFCLFFCFVLSYYAFIEKKLICYGRSVSDSAGRYCIRWCVCTSSLPICKYLCFVCVVWDVWIIVLFLPCLMCYYRSWFTVSASFPFYQLYRRCWDVDDDGNHYSRVRKQLAIRADSWGSLRLRGRWIMFPWINKNWWFMIRWFVLSIIRWEGSWE